jgi:hypothetical protein
MPASLKGTGLKNGLQWRFVQSGPVAARASPARGLIHFVDAFAARKSASRDRIVCPPCS